REILTLAGAMVVALAIRLAYVAITHGHPLAGDEPEYDIQGRFAAIGHWFWSVTPYGVAHPSLWKAPGYPAWVGAWYHVFGAGHYDRVLAVQTLFGPVNVG